MAEELQYRVLADYDVHDPNPLRLPNGTRVNVVRNDSTWPGWSWIEAKGQSGWIPDSYLETDNDPPVRRLNQTFDGTELSALRGTLLMAIKSAPGWIYALHPDGSTGWFPLFNLKPHPQI